MRLSGRVGDGAMRSDESAWRRKNRFPQPKSELRFTVPLALVGMGGTMLAVDAARIVHDWADREGLLSEGATATPSTTDAEFAAITPVSEAGKLALRAKQIESICFSEPESQITVFLKRAAPRTKGALDRLPGAVDNISIKYRQGRQTLVGSLPPQPFGSSPYVIRQAAGQPQFACGGSISVGNFRTGGTLGCLVRDDSGVLYGISNNHVCGNCSFADVGLPIIAPGIVDVIAGGLPPFTIGLHGKSLPLVSGSLSNVNPKLNSDASIFKIVNEGNVTSYQGDIYDTPSQVRPIIPGMIVEKVGRTTGHTKGKVMGQQYGVTSVPYAMPLYSFSGPVLFDPVFCIIGEGGIFSDNGDSGSLVTCLDEEGNRGAVGIVFAGKDDAAAPGGKVSLVLPLQPILTALGVALVTGHNVA
jgi:hypothetical protein